VEAFHWRYHPLADRMQALVAAGVVGRLRHIDATFCILQPSARDIRYRFDLAGGATMDLGCYLVHLVRHLTGAEPEVVAAEARRASADVDRWMRADLRLPDGATARITCALWSGSLIRIGARIVGDLGELRVTNPILPHRYHRLRLRTAGGTTRERVAGEATYVHQLRAFVRAVREGGPATTDAADGVANMRVVDAIYQAAGLPRRGRSPILEARTRR
jgi:predicted dehydrogenase